MTKEDRLKLLKLDLGRSTNAYDELLSQMLDAAAQMIAREGIELGDTAEDEELLRTYAAWLYRKRAQNNPVMPRSLRWTLNNRLMSRKAGGDDAS